MKCKIYYLFHKSSPLGSVLKRLIAVVFLRRVMKTLNHVCLDTRSCDSCAICGYSRKFRQSLLNEIYAGQYEVMEVRGNIQYPSISREPLITLYYVQCDCMKHRAILVRYMLLRQSCYLV